MQTKSLIEAGIAMVLAVYVAAALVPGAITSMVNVTNTTAALTGVWGSSITSLWNIMPLMVVIALVLMIYKFVK